MKFLSSTAIAALMLASGPALAADVYNQGGSTKDAPGVFDSPRTNHSGLYITGTLGVARGDRDATGTIVGEKDHTTLLDAEGKPKSGPTVSGGKPVDGLGTAAMIFTDILSGQASDDFDSTIFGGGVSYLWHRPSSRFGFEFGLDVTGYTDNESKAEFIGQPTVTGNGPKLSDPIAALYPDAGKGNIYGQAGVTSFERDFDIDLVAKAHLFVLDNVSLYVGGGVSIAQATAKGSHGTVQYPISGVLGNSFNKSDTSIGYVLLAGTQWWVTDRFVIGAEYSYKNHKFDKLEVEEDIHAIKARASLKLGGGLPNLD